MRTTGANRKYNREEKIEQRRHILERYKNYTGIDYLPDGKEFWTLGYKVIDDDGSYIEDSEYDFFLKQNFMKPEQYFSIDCDDKKTKQNKVINNANFFTGWFNRVIKSRTKNKPFNPGLLFYDTTCMPRNSINDFFDIIVYLLMRGIENCVFVYNVCLMAKGNNSSADIVNELFNEHDFSYLLRHIDYDEESHSYGNDTSTLMRTMFFYL